jgi:hypothetical protein
MCTLFQCSLGRSHKSGWTVTSCTYRLPSSPRQIDVYIYYMVWGYLLDRIFYCVILYCISFFTCFIKEPLFIFFLIINGVKLKVVRPICWHFFNSQEKVDMSPSPFSEPQIHTTSIYIICTLIYNIENNNITRTLRWFYSIQNQYSGTCLKGYM